MKKTKAMRLLDKEKLNYRVHDYSQSGCISALEVAGYLDEDPKRLFKTLVTQGKSGSYYVVLVPGDEELDFKKASKVLGEKSLSMVKSKDLLALTGYIHGGVSPFAMKKTFKTLLHRSATEHESIFISAGEIGLQLEVEPLSLEKLLPVEVVDVV